MEPFLSFTFSPAEQSFRKEGHSGEAKEKMGEQQDEGGAHCHHRGGSSHHNWTYNLCYC